MSLNDMVMIKDNHLLVYNSIENITKNARKQHKDVEVEVENQRDAMIAASSGATIVMLDNFFSSTNQKNNLCSSKEENT